MGAFNAKTDGYTLLLQSNPDKVLSTTVSEDPDPREGRDGKVAGFQRFLCAEYVNNLTRS